jgi:hypothetical protein
MLAEEAAERERNSKPQREEWMLAPPTDNDWASKVDPTKLKNRKFQTGKGAKAPAQKSGVDSMWTETPDQKRQRLADEVMGVAKTAEASSDALSGQNKAEAEATARRIQEYNVSRLVSLRHSADRGQGRRALIGRWNYRSRTGTTHYTVSIRKLYLARKKTIRVRAPSIETRIVRGGRRLDTRNGRSC